MKPILHVVFFFIWNFLSTLSRLVMHALIAFALFLAFAAICVGGLFRLPGRVVMVVFPERRD